MLRQYDRNAASATYNKVGKIFTVDKECTPFYEILKLAAHPTNRSIIVTVAVARNVIE